MTDRVSVTLSLQPSCELRERKEDLPSAEATVRYFSFTGPSEQGDRVDPYNLGCFTGC
jgi:hypothetical protein